MSSQGVLSDAGHQDLSLVDDILKGFDLTDALPSSEVFSQMTCKNLSRVSNLSRRILLESDQSSGDRDIDISLFEATLKNLERT